MVYVVTRRVIVVFHYELTKGVVIFSNIFSKIKRNQSLRPKFPDYVIPCDYDVTRFTHVV